MDLRRRWDNRRSKQAAQASAAAAATTEPRLRDVDLAAGAFFDVDNTVVRGASIFYLARGLYRHRFFRFNDLARFAWRQTLFVARGESLRDVSDARDRGLSLVAGHSVAELRAIGEEVYDQVIVDKVWPGTQELTRDHLAAGRRVWLVTASPIEVADVIARRLGLTGALATVAEHEDGIYTGRLIGEPLHGEVKAEAVRALAEREHLDLERCWAYSDSAHDIPLLSMVGNPVVVNPDKRLLAHAREHGWQVRDYRRGRRAARVGVPAVTIGGLAVGAVAARRRGR